jgi:acyl dehydratase
MTESETMLVAPDWPTAGSEMPPRCFGPFDREALARYAMASGDDNPLHLDPGVAWAAGLADTPVHGMLMFSCFEPFIVEWRAGLFIARLSAKFLRPVLAGEEIRIFGRVLRSQETPRPELILRLIARAPNNDPAILGEATVLYKGPELPH